MIKFSVQRGKIRYEKLGIFAEGSVSLSSSQWQPTDEITYQLR